MALKEFKLPDIGEGIAEGEIVSWKVETGQQVKEEDEFVEVMTDKATVMITAPFDGVVKELKANEGDVVPVESVIAVFEVGGGDGGGNGGGGGGKSAPAEDEKQEQAEQAPPAEDEPSAPRKQPQAERERQPRARPQQPAPSGDGAGETKFEQAEPGKVLAAPATRKRARELGIDLRQVPATGPSGRVTNEDLEQFVAEGGAAEAAPEAPAAAPGASRQPVSIPPAPRGAEDREERIPFRGLRRKIAEAMSRSKNTAAHFTYVDDIDVSELVALRREAKAMYEADGVNVTYLPFVMKAVVEANRKFPMMNAALDESTQELVIKHYQNFGIATDTEQGLIVPVLKDVDQKSVARLARELQELSQATREGKVGVDKLQGGTFTITNAGNIGGLFATPVINFPEVAILGVHAIKDAPVVRDGAVVPGKVMYLSISIDHRIVDGATGARWMNVVKDLLENPRKLLLGAL